ncbi:hypothetical protein F5Y11DRAFT_324268 [Daldinia sp. FL1419]|nr:hypothetical protein F5Y11DRAFT_324268 [Daldinia sp. FL1419]
MDSVPANRGARGLFRFIATILLCVGVIHVNLWLRTSTDDVTNEVDSSQGLMTYNVAWDHWNRLLATPTDNASCPREAEGQQLLPLLRNNVKPDYIEATLRRVADYVRTHSLSEDSIYEYSTLLSRAFSLKFLFLSILWSTIGFRIHICMGGRTTFWIFNLFDTAMALLHMDNECRARLLFMPMIDWLYLLMPAAVLLGFNLRVIFRVPSITFVLVASLPMILLNYEGAYLEAKGKEIPHHVNSLICCF